MSLQTDNTCLWVCVVILTSVDPDQRSVDWQVWFLHVNLWHSGGSSRGQPGPLCFLSLLARLNFLMLLSSFSVYGFLAFWG